MALLALAADYRDIAGVQIDAVSVNHGLRPEARDEISSVARTCHALGVPHHVLAWRRVGNGPVAQDAARRARHVLLADWAREAGHDTVALGHTRDDRLETFLLRARQGSGWRGLAGPLPASPSPVWPEGRGVRLIRPLLAFGREALRADLRLRGLDWIEDPSNEQDRFERVRMRRLLARMDDATRSKTLRVMDQLLEMRAAVAQEAMSLMRQVHRDGAQASLPLAARAGSGEEAWRRVIEALLMAAGGAPHAPRRDALDRLLARIAADDPTLARGVTLAGAKVRFRKGSLLAVAPAPARRGAKPPAGPDWGRAAALLAVPDLRSLRV